MARKTMCVNIDTARTAKFIGMSDLAQLLYYRLCQDIGPIGQVVPIMTCRAFDTPMECMQELYDNGYLIDVDDLTLVRHMWVNNKFEAKTGKLWNLPAYRNGILGFEGEYCHSAYKLLDGSVRPEPTIENGGKKPSKANNDDKEGDCTYLNSKDSQQNDRRMSSESLRKALGMSADSPQMAQRQPASIQYKTNQFKTKQGNTSERLTFLDTGDEAKDENEEKEEKEEKVLLEERLCECRKCHRQDAIFRNWKEWREIECKDCGTEIYTIGNNGLRDRWMQQNKESFILSDLDGSTETETEEGPSHAVAF